MKRHKAEKSASGACYMDPRLQLHSRLQKDATLNMDGGVFLKSPFGGYRAIVGPF